jgi:quercetin dioxygenase-like cupin family protein
MELLPKKPSTKGPAETFTGDVWFDVVARGEEPSRIRVNVVRFSPCARTAWHTHAMGQTLHVTEGVGLVQSRGGEVVVLRPGDTVYTRRPRLLHDPHRHVGGHGQRPRDRVGRPRHRRGVQRSMTAWTRDELAAIENAARTGASRSTPPARMRPSWRSRVPRNQLTNRSPGWNE